jgi:hypothetical protein
MWAADGARLAVFVGLVSLCLWSAGMKFYAYETAVVVGLRKLQADYVFFCGQDDANGAREDSPQEKRRNSCKIVVTDAYGEAQTKCGEYLLNEQKCRQIRGSVQACMVHTMNVDGCVNLVVRSAIINSGYTPPKLGSS